MTSHVVWPDGQRKPGLRRKNLKAIIEYINYHEPDKIINLGDWWDMPSLETYSPATASSREHKRIRRDIEAGNDDMKFIMDNLKYDPELIFCHGNHEYRLTRLGELDAKFEGMFDDAFYLEGWDVYDFLTPVCVDGVHYCHYFVNQYTGKPLGGTALSQLKNLGFSFTAGHKQCLDIARMDRNDGSTVQGLIAGASYTHDEGYKGAQGNGHWRGIVHKTNVKNGTYDLSTTHINNLIKDFT